jgi:putative membrane protein
LQEENMMDWYNEYGMGMGMWFGGFFMFLFWVIIIFLLLSILKKSGKGEKETAEDILKKRYARGEISRNEFELMKKEIER